MFRNLVSFFAFFSDDGAHFPVGLGFPAVNLRSVPDLGVCRGSASPDMLKPFFLKTLQIHDKYF